MAIIPNDEQFIGLSPSVNTTERRSALINAESAAYTMQDITDTVAAGMPPATNPDSQYVPYNYLGEFADSPVQVANPTAGYFGFPVLQTRVGQTITVPPGVDQTNVAPNIGVYGLQIYNHPALGSRTYIGDPSSNKFNLMIDTSGNIGSQGAGLYLSSNLPSGYREPLIVKRDGSFIQIGQQFSFNSTNIMTGVLANASAGTFRMNCNIASPNEGFLNASGAAGTLTLGVYDAARFGIEMYGPSIRIGSSFMGGAPSSPTSPVIWVRVTDEGGSPGGPFLYLPLYM